MKPRSCLVFCAVMLAAFFLRGQSTGPNPAQNPTVPTITYERLWEAATPQVINITVQSTGSTRYLSRNPVKPPNQADPDSDFQQQFTLSEENREKLFRAARAAKYFDGDFAFKKHPVATTGTKKLTYADQSRHFETTYDYSENKAIQEITAIFQAISNTLEHGRKLQYLHRYDRLGLEEELKGMENAAENHTLAELQLIAPTLDKIANDPAILNIARQRARKLLDKIVLK
jgi:hypothetical protein